MKRPGAPLFRLSPRREPLRAIARVLSCWLLISTVVSMPTRADATSEYTVKAAFLFKLTKYVQWPPSPPTFSIGVLGEDPFGNVLDQLVKGESINRRSVSIKRSTKVEDLKSCDVVFVSKSVKGQLRAIMHELGPNKILTVGDVDGFCREGGIINLIIDNGRLSFEINSTAAKKRGIVIDPQVLSLARIVDSDPG
jgi:hypothetical protein